MLNGAAGEVPDALQACLSRLTQGARAAVRVEAANEPECAPRLTVASPPS